MVTPGDSAGKTCTRRAAAARLVYRIWVDAPEDLRQRRGVERYRETHRQLWLDWMKVERQFFAEDRTRPWRTCESTAIRMFRMIRRPRS